MMSNTRSKSKPSRPVTTASSNSTSTKKSYSTLGSLIANASLTAPSLGISNDEGDLSTLYIDEDELDAPMDYLKKGMVYKKLNEELEKRSNEIFQKIESYSDKSRKISLSEAGDGDAPMSTDFSRNQNDTDRSSVGNPYASFFNSSRASSTAKSSKTTGKSGSCESIGSSKSSASDDDTVELTDLKHERRIKKATMSVVKCLQSKMVSYESRLTDLHLQFRQKIQENTMLESKVKALEEDREKLLKSISGLQSTSERFAKAAELAKSNLNLKMQAFAALKKDIDLMKREQRQTAGQLQKLQSRLNRAVEENDRLKNQTRSVQMNSRDKQQEDRSLIEELQQKVSSLEQQKNIMNATIGKQSSLIRTLRTQKVSLTPDRGTFY